MKIIFGLIFVFLVEIIFGNDFSDVENFKTKVEQEVFINNKMKEKKYDLIVKFPDLVYKKILFPEINKGEIYVYNKNQKKIFYPLLEQTIIQVVDENENEILNILYDLKDEKKEKEKIEILKNGNNLIKEIVYKTGEKIKFVNYSKIKNINFPTLIEVYNEDEVLISRIKFQEIEINEKLPNKVFEIGVK